ncbi:hypothetical protein FOA52_016095 [Chlamydomonas sp. UWO 241]|nr:hypothetical protein FOA52_016095 [Chlamydomonas sp. UWO 241]
MDVKLNVYIPELQTELLRFIRTGADSEKDRYVAIPETLELVDFPVDVQRLHVTYEFELDEKSLDKDVSHDAVVTRLAANVDFFDMSKVETSDMAHDGEWALCRDEVEIYARLLSNDKLSVQFVIIAKRRPIFYIINVMLPVWCIVLFSFLSFRFDSVELGARLQVTLTMVLTLVAFKLSVSTAKYVPITNSMNLMDRFMIAAFVMVALVALQNYIVFELLDIAPWLNIVSAWALIALWIATNAVVFTTFAKALAMVRSGDEVEKKKDVRRLREKDYNRVANLLTATEIQKGVRGIENMWSKHGATACRALEVVASLLEDRNETVRLCKLSLVVTEKKMSSNNPYTLSSVMYLADELESRGKLDEAATLYRRALEGRQKVLGPEHADTLITLNNLAVVLMRQDKLKEAEELHRMELAIREKALGRAHLDTLLSLNNLAITLGERHELNESEKLLREALKGRETVLGPEDPVTLQSVSNLADVLWEQGGDKQDEAEELAWKAMRGRQKVLGDRHVDTLDSLTSLAGMLADQGKRDKAEKLYKRALRSYEKVPGAGREAPVTLTCLHNLGYVLAKQGNVTEAEKVYRRALEARTKVLGPEHPDTLITLSNLADVLANQDKLGEAASLHRRALQARIKVLGPDDADTLESANSLADVLDKQGKGGEAEELRRSARTHPQH